MFGCNNYASHPNDSITGERIRFHSFPKGAKDKER